jgi:hypothetical protein
LGVTLENVKIFVSWHYFCIFSPNNIIIKGLIMKNKVKRLKAFIVYSIAVLSLAWTGVANAIPVVYDYSFDTPIFDEPAFAALNALLAPLGDSISGTISFDTDDKGSFPPIDWYSVFTHTGELDTAGFDVLPNLLRTSSASDAPLILSNWLWDDGSSSFSFAISWSRDHTSALCDARVTEGCGGFPNIADSVGLVNSSLVRRSSEEVPLPGTFALLALGLLLMRSGKQRITRT